MSDITNPSREFLNDSLYPIVAEWLRSGIENMADVLKDQRENPDPANGYALDAVTRHVSDVLVDDTGRVVVKIFGGDLFLYRITLTEL